MAPADCTIPPTMLPSSPFGTAVAPSLSSVVVEATTNGARGGETMSPQSLIERLLKLEKQMSELSELPKKVDDLALQVSQLRAEMHGEFSAVRGEVATGFAAVRGEMATEFAAVRGEMAAGFAAVRGEMATGFAAVRGEISTEFAAVRGEIKEGDEETRRQMRVLHEEVISRIALLQEGVARGSRKRARGHS
jgi:hypothetical protein